MYILLKFQNMFHINENKVHSHSAQHHNNHPGIYYMLFINHYTQAISEAQSILLAPKHDKQAVDFLTHVLH